MKLISKIKTNKNSDGWKLYQAELITPKDFMISVLGQKQFTYQPSPISNFQILWKLQNHTYMSKH